MKVSLNIAFNYALKVKEMEQHNDVLVQVLETFDIFSKRFSIHTPIFYKRELCIYFRS